MPDIDIKAQFFDEARDHSPDAGNMVAGLFIS
jgi:hypothetical protein